MKTRYAFLFLFALLLIPALALAADNAASAAPWYAGLLTEAVKAIAALVGLAVTYALHRLAAKLDKDGRYIDEKLIARAADAATAEAEEWGAAHASSWAGKHKGPAKLKRAVARIIDKVPGISTEKAEQAAHAALVWAGNGLAEKLAARRKKAEIEAAEKELARNP